MGKHKHRLSLLPALLTVCALLLFAGCNAGTEAPAETAEEPAPDVVLPLEGEDAYVIIRPEDISKEEIALVTELRKLIADKTGATVQIKDDFVREGTQFQVGEREICFGLTNREESQRAYEGLRYEDYRIRLDGTKLVIAYGSVDAGTKAIRQFAEDYVSADEKTIVVPQNLYFEVAAEYALDTITIAGRDISEYVIVGDSSFTSTLRDKIAQATGILLRTAVKSDGNAPSIKLGTLKDLGPEEVGVRLVDGDVVAGSSGEYYHNSTAISLLVRILTESGGKPLTEKDLNQKEKAMVEYKLPFKRGINVNGLESHAYTEENNFFKDPFCYYLSRDDTFTQIAERGFDHVRLPVDLRNYYDAKTGKLITEGEYNIAYLDGIIQRAFDAGLYVTLDLHGWWQFAASTAEDRELFVAVWEHVAEHYKDWDEKLCFELCNEPAYSETVTTVQNDAIAAIRKTNPTRLILVAVRDGNQAWMINEVSLPKGDENLGIVIHLYSPADFTHQGATWSDPKRDHQVRLTDEHLKTLQWDLDEVSKYMQAHPDVPIVINEFAVQQNVADREDIITWLTKIRMFCEVNGIPWAYWQYMDSNSLTSIRTFCEENNIPFNEEQYKKYISEGMGARYGWDEDWKDYVLEGLGLK